MTRRWTTPVIWLAFTALATVVGLVSVSVVRHAVVATSLRPTAASEVSTIVGSASPSATETPAATPSGSPSPQPTKTHPRPTTSPTTYSPAPSDTPTTSTPTAVDTPTPPPSPTTPPLFTQAYPQGTIEVACTSGGVQVMYVAAAPNYVPSWAPNDRRGIDFVFHPSDGYDQGNELAVSVSCQHGVATWRVDH